MTGALIGLQVLCIIIFAVALVMARRSRHTASLRLIGLTYWSTVLGLGRPE